MVLCIFDKFIWFQCIFCWYFMYYLYILFLILLFNKFFCNEHFQRFSQLFFIIFINLKINCSEFKISFIINCCIEIWFNDMNNYYIRKKKRKMQFDRQIIFKIKIFRQFFLIFSFFFIFLFFSIFSIYCDFNI